MSSYTLPSIRTRVLVKIRQIGTRKQTYSPVEVDQTIRDTYFEIQGDLPPVHAFTASAGTIAAGANTFVLPSTSNAEYRGAVKLQLVSNNRFLRKLNNEEMDGVWDGQSSNATGIPHYFALYEEDDQEAQGRCHPRATVTETYNLWRSLVPADFDLTAVGSTNIRLNRFAASALVFKSAAALVDAMDQDSLKLRRLNAAVAARWDAAAAKLIYRTAMDMHALLSNGRTHRYVA